MDTFQKDSEVGEEALKALPLLTLIITARTSQKVSPLSLVLGMKLANSTSTKTSHATHLRSSLAVLPRNISPRDETIPYCFQKTTQGHS
jgi:hypothetical protein